MTTPKPAPSKPLTFTPPQYLKGESKPSELPFVEGAEPNVINKKASKHKGLRPNVTIVDEIHHGNGNVELVLGSTPDSAMTGFSEAITKTSDEVKKFADAVKPAEKPKKPFVLDRHLTQRPFHDDRLMQLKARLQRPSFKNR